MFLLSWNKNFKETNRTINFRTLEANFEESIGTIKIT